MARKAQKIKDLNPIREYNPYGVYSRYAEYLNLLMNAVKITTKNGEPLPFATETFIKSALFERGAVGYDKISKNWFYVYGEGIDDFGNPLSLIMITANGHTFTRPAYYDDDPDGAYLIKALPSCMSMGALIKETTDFMTQCDIAMRQNVEACKTPYIVICNNEDLRLSFEQAIQQKQKGQAVILVSNDVGEGMKSINIGVEYLADKFLFTRNNERDTLLNKLGIVSSNDAKKERIQSAEINATIGQATDYIYLLIDTFNKQMDTYSIDCEMSLNGALEEIYLSNDEDIKDIDVNDVEERNEIQ